MGHSVKKRPKDDGGEEWVTRNDDIAEAGEIWYTEPEIFKGSDLCRNNPGMPT
jgi:hypothetical protein